MVDTNALLVPYGVGSDSLSQIQSTYRKLADEKRLVIPAQVAREFARNRAAKLSELFARLSTQRDELPTLKRDNYPMFEALPEYQHHRVIESKIHGLLNEYRKSIGALVGIVKAWEWNDPVSLIYGQIFPDETIVDINVAGEDGLRELQKRHQHRVNHQIPPGYKDGAKTDGGIGDFLIWLTILKIGAERKVSVIFVSGEEKADWWHRSNKQPLYPRFELVDEFRRASGGCSFHIIKLSSLLELFEASSEVVAEVKKEEQVTASNVPLTSRSALVGRAVDAERAVARWLIENGYNVLAGDGLTGFHDYLATKNGETFFFDIILVREPASIRMRLRQRMDRMRGRVLDVSNFVIVVVGENDIDEYAARVWKDLNVPYRLFTGVLTPGGQFQPTRMF